MFETKQVADHARESIYMRTGVDITRPSQLYISVTTRCNYQCKMCIYWSLPDDPELSTEEWFQVLDHLGRWPGPGTKLNISGGEPLLRDDLISILARASQVGFAAGIVTNGSLLDESAAEELIAAGLFNVNVSLDSLDPSINDRLRGYRGATEKAVAAIDRLMEAKSRLGSRLAVILKATAMEPTLDGLVDLVDFAKQRGISGVLFQGISTPPGPGATTGWRESSGLWPRDSVKVTGVFDTLIAMKKKGLPILNSKGHLRSIARYLLDPSSSSDGVCRVGSTNLTISASGTVPAICDILEGSHGLGNVSIETAEAIWKSPAAREARRKARDCRRNCVLTNQRSRSFSEKVGLYLHLH